MVRRALRYFGEVDLAYSQEVGRLKGLLAEAEAAVAWYVDPTRPPLVGLAVALTDRPAQGLAAIVEAYRAATGSAGPKGRA
jgi:hypothetical protein